MTFRQLGFVTCVQPSAAWCSPVWAHRIVTEYSRTIKNRIANIRRGVCYLSATTHHSSSFRRPCHITPPDCIRRAGQLAL